MGESSSTQPAQSWSAADRNGSADLEGLDGGLIVSVQAPEGSPLRSTPVIVALARAAASGGAVGLRVNGPDDVAGVRAITGLPIIGLHKEHNGRRSVITVGIELARGLALAGADIIALDATAEVRGSDFSIIGQVKAELGRPVMADVSTFDEGLRAWDAGADIVATTLSGYTPESAGTSSDPDIALVARLAAEGMRVVAEGRYRTPSQVAAARDAGASAVVVGGAITDPTAITARFVVALDARRGMHG